MVEESLNKIAFADDHSLKRILSIKTNQISNNNKKSISHQRNASHPILVKRQII